MKQGNQLLVVSDRSPDEILPMLHIPDCWHVDFAAGLQEGLRFLQGARPDLVIADIPVFDLSQKITELVQEHQETAFVPILHEKDADKILKCFRAGTYDVLVEPFDQEAAAALFARLDKYWSLLRENRLYRAELEKVNRELKDSLRILELDQKAGKQVQQNMLPESPVRRGDYEIAFKIAPSLFLSGDFVGYNFVFDRFLLFYLADVSGHGASSAFITVLLRFWLNKIIRRHIQSDDAKVLGRAPEGFIEHINRQLISMNVDKHMTIFGGAIDMERHILRYSVAAHMPAPIFLAENDARFIQGKGKPVGIFPDAHWEVEEIALPEKFLLTLTSDGVLDFIEGDSLQDKMNDMLKAVRDSDGSLVSICKNLNVHEVENVPDDVTVMTVSRGY